MGAARFPRSVLLGCAVAVCGAIAGGIITPALASDGSADAGSALLGDFAVGDGLEAMIDERDGAMRLRLPVAGLGLSWDSRRAGRDRAGLGKGWNWGFGALDTEGGVRVFPAWSGPGFEMDSSTPSGLLGYGVDDVRFVARHGELPARDGVDESRPYSFVLFELGGVANYFSSAGDPVARVESTGARQDWTFDPEVPHRLVGVVDERGVRTDLSWEPSGNAVTVRRAANVGSQPSAEWRITMGAQGLDTVTDPLGQATVVRYDDSAFIESITGASGASTRVDWRQTADGVPRIDSVRTVDTHGSQLSARTWQVSTETSPTGWPTSAEPGLSGFGTQLSDGRSHVASSYTPHGLLTHRELNVSTSSGSRTAQAIDVAYPGSESRTPTDMPRNWARPSVTRITYSDAAGRSRAVSESSRWDEYGRVVEHTTADGRLTMTEYDPTIIQDAGIPVGLIVRETVRTPDGLVRDRTHTLNDERDAVVGTEVHERGPDGVDHLTERIEYEVDDRGFVTERRQYAPEDASLPPITTRWTERVELGEGRVTTTETAAAGTPAESTTAKSVSLAHGGVVEEIDALGNRTATEHDALGRPTVKADAAGRVTSMSYTTVEGSSAVLTRAPDGVERIERRDALGRVVEVSDNIDRGVAVPGHVRVVETREYEPGRVVVTDAWGAVNSETYDVFGRPIVTEAATGAAELTVYDDVANTTRSGRTATDDLQDAEVVHVRRNDAAGQVVETSDLRADGSTSGGGAIGFDGLGRMTFSTDGALHRRVALDQLGRPASTELSAVPEHGLDSTGPLTAELEFDAFGREIAKSLSLAAETRPGYSQTLDELGRTIRETSPSGDWTSYTYTVDGLVQTIETSAGQRTELEYDPLTRALTREQKTSPAGAEIAAVREYDPKSGRLTSVADAHDPDRTRIAYEHDAFGNVVKVTYPDTRAIQYAYDSHGRKIRFTDVAGNRTDYAYTDAGLLERAVLRDASGGLLAEVAYVYDEFGRVRAIDRGNGLATSFTFTAEDQIASEATSRDDVPLSDRTYTYDPHGDLTRRIDVERDAPGGEPETTRTDYRYDPFHRLVASTVRAGGADEAAVTRQTEYVLTLGGDIAEERVRTHPGTPTEALTERRFRYSQRGELQSVTTSGIDGTAVAEQHYDAAGNLLRSADGTTYVYDAARRPVMTTSVDGTTSHTEYWADGTRKSQRTTDGRRTSFYWDGAILVNELASGDELGVASYLIGASRHARVVQSADPRTISMEGSGDLGAGTSTTYYGSDRHGNITDLTGPSGEVLTRYAYSDYGAATAREVTPSPVLSGARDLVRNPFQYAGEYADRDGTQHLATRSYSAQTMRFTTMDDAPLENRFAFADLNPIMHLDPTGRTSALDVVNWVVAGLAVVSAAASIVGASIAAMASSSLTALCVVAVGADVVALGFATAGVVDIFADFMSDEIAGWVALGDIALGVGIGLGLYMPGALRAAGLLGPPPLNPAHRWKGPGPKPANTKPFKTWTQTERREEFARLRPFLNLQQHPYPDARHIELAETLAESALYREITGLDDAVLWAQPDYLHPDTYDLFRNLNPKPVSKSDKFFNAYSTDVDALEWKMILNSRVMSRQYLSDSVVRRYQGAVQPALID